MESLDSPIGKIKVWNRKHLVARQTFWGNNFLYETEFREVPLVPTRPDVHLSIPGNVRLATPKPDFHKVCLSMEGSKMSELQ